MDVERAVRILNELLEIDRPAIAALVANRVPCNHRLASHPFVQVGVQHGGYWVGMLGILNGLFDRDENGEPGAIVAEFDEGNLVRFSWELCEGFGDGDLAQ